jgi:hypothetical protein
MCFTFCVLPKRDEIEWNQRKLHNEDDNFKSDLREISCEDVNYIECIRVGLLVNFWSLQFP